MKAWIRWAAPTAVIVLSTLTALVFQNTTTGQRLEQGFYDLRFGLRGPLPQPKNTPVTILAVDDATFDTLTKPLVFWQDYFGEVVRHLNQAGAAAVGMDFLFFDMSEWNAEGQQVLVGAVLEANQEAPRVVLGYRIAGRDVIQLPFQLTVAAGDGGLGYVNLTTDSDDFVRRQALYAPSDEGGEAASFAAAVLQAFTGKKRIDFVSTPGSPNEMLINYRGLEVFPQVSFWRAVQAAQQGDLAFFDQFKGRIVLIGEVAEEDRHPTPLYYWVDRRETRDKARTAGVIIHANAMATILEGDFIRQLPEPWQALVILLAVAATAWIGFRSGSVNVLTASLLTGAFAAAVFALMAFLFARGVYVYLTGPLVGVFVAGAASMAANYILEGREKRQLRNLFKRYVDDTVIEQILAQPNLALAGERKSVAVLFSDIRNFTGRSENLPPEELVRRLNHYFEKMVRAILSNRGTVDKFIGDGIMAIFGAPLQDPEAPLHAVQAGQAMLEELAELNREWSEEGFDPIRIGIGIHCGEAVVGNIGSPQKMEYTAIGDVVNTASRIEGLNKSLGTEFLISGETYDAVAGKIAAERLPDETVKGKARAVRVYRVAAPPEAREAPLA